MIAETLKIKSKNFFLSGKTRRLCSFVFPIMSLLLSVSCGNKSGKASDTPTSGNITIAADETLWPIVEAETDTFQSTYKYAKIKTLYLPENDAVQAMLQDSARLVIATRPLNKEEEAYFRKIKITVKPLKIAIDAIAFIVHPGNSDTTLTKSLVRDIVSGKVKTWADVRKGNDSGPIQIVFDNAVSSTVRYITDSVAPGIKLPENCFAAKTNEEVIEYVAKHENALGIIGVNWISDSDDGKVLGFLDKIKVVGIESDKTPGTFFKPYQAYIADRSYPYTRSVWLISREARTGLGTGFASYISSDKGQRIILKSGLVPATMPVRLIQVKKENYEIEK